MTGPAVDRRTVCATLAGAAAAAAAQFSAAAATGKTSMKITCMIRYRIDPFQRSEFATYAKAWLAIIPRLGGGLLGYFLPHEGTNDVAWAMISFGSLAEYEAYRARLRADPEAMRNFAFAVEKRFILREERTFLENVTA